MCNVATCGARVFARPDKLPIKTPSPKPQVPKYSKFFRSQSSKSLGGPSSKSQLLGRKMFLVSILH